MVVLAEAENPTPLPEPFQDLHEIYTAAKTEDIKNRPGTWNSSGITVMKNGEPIFEYVRSYSFSREFEPFRQLQGDRWHDYALISSDYTTFQVLDLESREVVATRPYPQRPWYRRDGYDQYEKTRKDHPEFFEPGGYYEGKGPDDLIDGEGFCPVEFYVPDPYEDYYPGIENGKPREDVERYRTRQYFEDEVQKATGQLGFYSGCIWGDDTSWKLRAIDLSKISEGVVTDDERFGYWELPGGRLKDNVNWEYGSINTQIYVDMKSGKASWYTRDGINWGEKQ